MKKGTLITICLLIIAAVSLFLWYIVPQEKLSNIVQADAIIALVFITLFYARQTQELVNQEKISLKEQRMKMNADFGERKLKEFYMPLKGKLLELEVFIKDIPEFTDVVKHITYGVVELIDKYGYMIKKETDDATYELIKILHEIKKLSMEEEEIKIWRDAVLVKANNVEKLNNEEINYIQRKIDEMYKLFADEDIEKSGKKKRGES